MTEHSPRPGADLEAVQRELARLGPNLTISIEYPGCVVVWAEDLAHPSASYWFGTANDTWQGDWNDAGGEYLGETLDTGVASSEPDPAIVAAGIHAVLNGERR